MKNTRTYNYVIKHDGFISDLDRSRRERQTAQEYLESLLDGEGSATLMGDSNDLFYPLSLIEFSSRELAEKCPYAVGVLQEYCEPIDETKYYAVVRQARIWGTK